jgi:hypothetical protein
VAAAGAGILTLGLVTAPPNPDIARARAETQAVRLAAVTAAHVPLPVVNAAAPVPMTAITPSRSATSTPPESPFAAATPHANAVTTTEIVTSVVWTVGAIALAPIWYVGFPVTLPLSIVLGNALYAFGHPLSPPPDVLTSLGTGVALFAALPVLAVFTVASPLLSALNPPPTSSPVPATATVGRTTSPSIAPPPARKANHSLAGSRRAAASSRVPAATAMTEESATETAVETPLGGTDTAGVRQGRRQAANAGAKGNGSNRATTAGSGRGNSNRGRPD